MKKKRQGRVYDAGIKRAYQKILSATKDSSAFNLTLQTILLVVLRDSCPTERDVDLIDKAILRFKDLVRRAIMRELKEKLIHPMTITQLERMRKLFKIESRWLDIYIAKARERSLNGTVLDFSRRGIHTYGDHGYKLVVCNVEDEITEYILENAI
ncbi:MAG: hypothetical protein KBC17_03635 [Candidatus Pacebacteria bacterium]|nr:hypothetical protein [Candidatus Paceibacterota bacterium]